MSLLSNMRGPRLKTPLLLLLLLLLSSLTEKAFSQDGEEEEVTEPTQLVEEEAEETEAELPATHQPVDSTMETHPIVTDPSAQTEEDTAESGSGSSADVEYVNSTDPAEGANELDLLTILIPAILGVVLIAAIICGTVIIKRQCNKSSTNQEQSKEDPYLDGSSTEKVPMPMFEEDVPSVLELEMDELDKWMQKDF